MTDDLIIGFLLPFVCTSLGAAGVFFFKNIISDTISNALYGFSAGVMLAASIWSLILPSIEKSAHLGCFSFLPASAGVFFGMAVLLCVEKFFPTEKFQNEKYRKNTAMLVLAVILHNIPEGMAVGAAYSTLISGVNSADVTAPFMLSLGIAIQNLPEGAIISMPLHADGINKGKSFILGVLSGIVEPIAAVITFLLSAFITALLPLFLSFAAGAMLYVVSAELLPDAYSSDKKGTSVLIFAFGFILMMSLDVCFG